MFKENLKLSERNYIRPVVQVGMDGVGNNKQLFIVPLQAFKSVPAEITRVSFFAVYNKYRAAYFVAISKYRHIDKG